MFLAKFWLCPPRKSQNENCWEFSAVIDIQTGDVLEGDLPRNKMKLVQAWLEIHRDEIVADWSLAVRGLPVQKIKPLE